MRYVKYDCRPGDVLRFQVSPAIQVSAKVVSSDLVLVEVEFENGAREAYTYADLHKRAAFYVSSAEGADMDSPDL